MNERSNILIFKIGTVELCYGMLWLLFEFVLVATRVDSLAFCDVRFLLKVFIIIELLKFLQTFRIFVIIHIGV